MRSQWRRAFAGLAAGALVACGGSDGARSGSSESTESASGAGSSRVTARVLDVGQGDATLIENGGSRILIDGGPEMSRLGALLDSLGLNGSTIDVVILTHSHADHLVGLRELFQSDRNITVKYFFENGDPSAGANIRHLRDSVAARVARGQLVYRDTDDPCGNGNAVCIITMHGGAKLEIMRPMPASPNPNDRSVPVKLVGPDSASFTMWFAGDAEQEEIGWFLGEARYDSMPGMAATILKADHHGSCNGVTSAYLAAVQPRWVAASVGAINSYHHMHTQAEAAYAAAGTALYRTDENGTITFTSPGTPGGKLSVRVQRGDKNLTGRSDARSTQPACNPIP